MQSYKFNTEIIWEMIQFCKYNKETESLMFSCSRSGYS